MIPNAVNEMNIDQLIVYYAQHPESRDNTFLMYRKENGELQRVSYEQFYLVAQQYAGLIRKFRLKKNKKPEDRFHVGFFMQNTPEVIYLLGGCAFTGSTLVGINNAQVGEKLAADIENIEIDVLFVDEVEQPKTGKSFLENVLEAKEQYGFKSLDHSSIIARKKQPFNHPESVSTIEENIAACKNPSVEPTPLNPNNPGIIIFTSGTTGLPKGIEVAWKKVFDTGVVSANMLNYSNKDVGYICMPLNHSNSIYLNFMPALLTGAKVFIRRRFSTSEFVKDIEETGATVWNSVGDPVMYIINRLGPDADYSHLPLRTVTSTGTNAQNRSIFSRIFGLESFAETYGSTESGALVINTPETPSYCVGEFRPGTDIKITRENSLEECELAEIDENGLIENFEESVGEITVSQKSLGDSAFTGYYKMPEDSAKKINEHGYYCMGDLGAAIEKEGKKYLIFLGRTGTDRLRSKGENFSTRFVENIILKFDGVMNGAVIGIPHPASTENDNPLYILEVSEPSSFDVGSFYGFCQKELPDYALPGYIKLLDQLPKTDTEKIRKPVLLHDFVERNPNLDAKLNNVIYKIDNRVIFPFRTEDYIQEMRKCIDPAVQARFRAVTGRNDLFKR